MARVMLMERMPITVLVAAVGGQGGQLFSQWLFDAAKIAGFAPVGVGLPGLSQREGATTYYLEFFANPEETSLFSPFPEKGQVQILIGLELLELLRAIQSGYLSTDGVIIGSTHRVLTADEKLPIKGGFVTEQQALPILYRAARRCIVFDAVKAATFAGLSERAANAILLGALAASEVLPFPTDAFRKAIEHYGVAVNFNLRAFEFGLKYREWSDKLNQIADEPASEWEQIPEPNLPEAVLRKMEALSLDDELAMTLRYAARWLCHYQDARYFARYLDCIQAICERDRERSSNLLVTKEVARILALRMAYEDAIRVAQLKTQRQRFARLRREHHIADDVVYRVVDFFSPDWDELTGLLPVKGARDKGQEATKALTTATDLQPLSEFDDLPPLPSQVEELKRPAVQMKLETTSLLGFLTLKALLLLKPLRPYSRRFKSEWEAIMEWLSAVDWALSEDYDLAFLVARSGEMVRGYGRTRRKTLSAWRTFIAFLRALRRRGTPMNEIVSLGEQFLELAMSGPQGPEKAWQFAKEQLARM
jgi:indolepyruvate ferredoxin oxidoreductase beta subunit